MLQSFKNRVRQHTHSKREHLFRELLVDRPRPMKIIDLGGTAAFWKKWGISEDDRIEITLINNHHIDKTNMGTEGTLPFIRQEIRDARDVSESEYEQFDLIFSNSFLEHLESADAQRQICEKIEASGRDYFVQVPNKYSLIEPHFPHPLVPFFALYPKSLQAWLLTKHHFGSGSREPSYESAKERLKYSHPLGIGDVRKLLPSATVVKEYTFGIPLSIVARRRGPRPQIQ